jgi:hypothetical protein
MPLQFLRRLFQSRATGHSTDRSASLSSISTAYRQKTKQADLPGRARLPRQV